MSSKKMDTPLTRVEFKRVAQMLLKQRFDKIFNTNVPATLNYQTKA